ncbi:IS1595 family transposase, partial [bacterium]|nr:IS1595 family transposase [bacterium]
TLKPILQKQVQKDTHIMTDDAKAYKKLNKHFPKHDVICHSKGEYSRGIIYTNTIENFFSILKRGLTGVFQHVSEHHLQRYVSEFDFRYSRRKMSDTERFTSALSKIVGKRLMYRQPLSA